MNRLWQIAEGGFFIELSIEVSRNQQSVTFNLEPTYLIIKYTKMA